MLVNSDTTLSELRLMIYEKLEIPPLQQMLAFHSVILNGDSKAIGEFGIAPYSEITVTAVTEMTPAMFVDSTVTQARPGIAFEGCNSFFSILFTRFCSHGFVYWHSRTSHGTKA